MSGSEQESTHRTIERVARESYGRLIAYLSSHTRDVGSAEDALSNALVAALGNLAARRCATKSRGVATDDGAPLFHRCCASSASNRGRRAHARAP